MHVAASRRTPTWPPPLLTLLAWVAWVAWVAWRQGDTIPARHALCEVTALDSKYVLAHQLHRGFNLDAPADGFLYTFRNAAAEASTNDEAALRAL